MRAPVIISGRILAAKIAERYLSLDKVQNVSLFGSTAKSEDRFSYQDIDLILEVGPDTFKQFLKIYLPELEKAKLQSKDRFYPDPNFVGLVSTRHRMIDELIGSIQLFPLSFFDGNVIVEYGYTTIDRIVLPENWRSTPEYFDSLIPAPDHEFVSRIAKHALLFDREHGEWIAN